MRVMGLIIKRNIVRTFRNKAAVFIVALMSFLPAVMLLVLGDMWMIPMLTYIIEDTEVAWTILRFNILAITLAVAVFTAPVSILGLVSEDFEKKTINNFLTAPIKRSHISLSYIISGVLFGLIICILVLVLGQVFLLISGDGFIGVGTIIKLLLISVLVLSSLSTVFFFIMSGIKSVQTSGTMTGLIGGFAPILGGVYIQLSLFPQVVGTVLNFLPFSHTLSLFKRQVLSPLVEKLDLSMEVTETLYESLTVNLSMFGQVISPLVSFLVIIACMVLFCGLSILRFKNMKKN